MTEITTTPWGKPDTQTVIAEGIIAVTTPSHGGIWLSPERLAEMPEHLRSCSFTHDNWFEEDTAWCAVALTWPLLLVMTPYLNETLGVRRFLGKSPV